jgi:RNA polymerase sigma-70 factor (ECF subfamily)
MDRQSEQDLIHAALAGDRGAAAGLIQAHQASLYAFMLRRCGRPEMAEDVVQEAFVRALTNLHRFDTRFRFSTWLFTIAKRLHCNAVQKHAPTFDSDLVAFSADDASTPPLESDLGEERTRTRSDLDEALARLPEVQREIVVLFHQCDWPIARIAEHFLMPAGTVKSHLHRGRRKLRVALEAVRADRAALRSAHSHTHSEQRVDRGVSDEN